MLRRVPRVLGLALVVTWLLGPELAAPQGSLSGVVRYAGPPVERKKVKVTVDHSVCGQEKDAEQLVVSPEGGLRGAVVSLLNPPPDTRRPPAPPVQMDQKACVFLPRVIIVPAGNTVEFLNSDRLLHNLHSAGTVNPVFNRTQPRGRTIPIAFQRPEIVRIDCDLHPWMRAWVVVTEHPFHAVTGPQGEFALGAVPSGRYTLQVWHETLGTTTREVTVGDAATTVTIPMGAR